MTKVCDLYTHPPGDKEIISVLGWVRSNRDSKKVGFIIINDGTTFENLQVVYKPEDLANFDEVTKVRISSVVKITGRLVLTPNARQAFEVQATMIEIIDLADEDFPLQKKEHSYEYLREIAHLRGKTNTFSAVFRIRSGCAFAIHEFFIKKGFIYLNSPIITENDAEGAGESFVVTTRSDDKYQEDFFGKKASLTVSGQLHAESFAQIFRQVYTFGPTFRAENSNTTRHAAEFWMIEPEVAFNDLHDNMVLAEEMIKYIINYLFAHHRSELGFLNEHVEPNLLARLEIVRSEKFERITYTTAIELLAKAVSEEVKFENSQIEWGMDLQTEHERYLCEKIYQKPVFITDYPLDIKAFYMKINDDDKTVAACDLLMPGIGELVGGSQRENDYQKILTRCQQMNIEPRALEWYLNLRRFGYYKSAGFGLGFERLIMYVTGMTNIRDVIPFPRTPRNLLY